jgi:hypothetical protein
MRLQDKIGEEEWAERGSPVYPSLERVADES